MKIENMVTTLGFPPLQQVASFRSVAHLFGRSKNRCGIYLLEFSNSVFYIGKAVDVVKRFSQHRGYHDDIIGFSFIVTARQRLDEIEKQLIFAAENLGFVLSNIVHATNVVGDTDLDLIVSQYEQETWIENPEKVNGTDDSLTIKFAENVIHRSRKKFAKLKAHQHSDVIIDLLKTYTNCCVLLPKRTEYSFWSLSCMPSTRRRFGPTLAVINMSCMETFVIGQCTFEENDLYGYINVASDTLKLDRRWHKKIYMSRFLPFSKIKKFNYKDAGQHQLTLIAYGAEDIYKLLNDSQVKCAAAELNLRLMRKRASINSKTHCVDLARQFIV